MSFAFNHVRLSRVRGRGNGSGPGLAWPKASPAGATLLIVRTANRLLDTLVAGRGDRVTHIELIAAREGRTADWPRWLDPEVSDRLGAAGIRAPWAHQAEAASHAWHGRSVIVATGTASGKSLAYLLPALTAARAGRRDGGTTLYLAPTKALAADQLRALDQLAVPDVLAATLDGDTPAESRDFTRDHATYLLTNPDMLHRSILPRHRRWAGFLRSLRFVVVDECHTYRGVFGSHVAQVLRRLRRVCAVHGADPTFVLASATAADPAVTATRLTGVDVVTVEADASPRGAKECVLWEPPLDSRGGENGAPVRRSALAEAADLLSDLVVAGSRTVAFVRSRRAAETVATLSRARLAAVDATLAEQVAAYRAGYLPHERRELEQQLQTGSLQALAATTALELGVDVSGLDAVLIAGWPGTRASFWQQAGRAGRSGLASVAVLIGRDDPLDHYLVRNPEAVFGETAEATVLDPDNPYVLAPHLCAAAQETPITDDDIGMFGSAAPAVLAELESQRMLRRRSAGWFWVRRGWPQDLADLRGSGGPQVQLVETGTGRLLGTVDAARAHSVAHAGAVYVHQGETYLVEQLDLDEHVAFVRAATLDYTTTARDVTDLRILGVERSTQWGEARLCFGDVEVSSQVVAFLKRRLGSGEVLGEVPLDLPARHLRTKAVWWTLPDRLLPVHPTDAPGAAHAAEHAAIGMLPLFATCDRWDIGGLSTAQHADTGLLTVFVHDGHPGGAGFAERAFEAAPAWLRATRDAVASCSCREGCPSCVQSPKCGNGNDPLDKAGAVRLLTELLTGAPMEY
jgi:DEAD/DEAH box helicase domain-containing protein